MKKVNVITNATYSTIAGRHELGNLSKGALAILNEDGVKLDFASLDLTDRLNWYVGGQVGVQEVNVDTLKMKKEIYQAGVNKKVNIGYNGSSGDIIAEAPFTLGDFIGVSIHNVDYFDNEKPYRTYTVDLTEQDTMADAIVRLVAKINYDADNVLVSAVAHVGATKEGIELTGKAHRNFNVSTLGLLDVDEVVETTPYRVGFGITELVQQEVDDNAPEVGDRYRKSEVDGYERFVVPAANYHCYTLRYSHLRQDMMQSFNQNAIQTYRLYVPITATNLIGKLDSILAEL